MSPTAPLEDLETRLGHAFSDRNLLLRALTHKSLLADPPAASDAPASTGLRDNEQLEFLGDAILGFLASEHLVRLRPQYPEGKLSRLKAHLVSASHLYEIAIALRLGDHLILGRSEEVSGGRAKRAILANAVEAVIAALYLDTGPETGPDAGLAACRAFLERYAWSGLRFDDLEQEIVPLDPKSALQELAQARKLPVPRYSILQESGPEHAKTFTVEVRVGRDLAAHAQGTSKKSAGQRAAELLLSKMSESAA